jgi:hypothetical protein
MTECEVCKSRACSAAVCSAMCTSSQPGKLPDTR